MISEKKHIELRQAIYEKEISNKDLFNELNVKKRIPEVESDKCNIKDTIILNRSVAHKGLMGYFNERSKKCRKRRYDKKIQSGFNGIKIVSEGDSWFQYPIFLTDVIDHLMSINKYAIYSLGSAGDWLSNMSEEGELFKEIENKKPRVVLISGGGNDLLQDHRICTFIKSYYKDRKVEDYLNSEFDAFLCGLKFLYGELFAHLNDRFPEVKIICHGYDYAIPFGGRYIPWSNYKYLGKPMKYIGIEDQDLRSEIVREMINRFNETLIKLTNIKNTFHLDLRNSVCKHEWFDEIHPSNKGFENIAKRYVKLINEVV